jgi:hypothetical protein
MTEQERIKEILRLDSENQHIKYYQQGYREGMLTQIHGEEKAMQMLQNPSDELIDNLIESKDLNRFFKPTTPIEIKRNIIKGLPSFAPVAIGVGAYNMQNKAYGGEIQKPKKIQDLKKYLK